MSTYKYKNISSLTPDLVKRDLYLVILLISSLSGKASWESLRCYRATLVSRQTALFSLSSALRQTGLFLVRNSSNNPSSYTQSSSLNPRFLLFYLLGNHSLFLLRETCLSLIPPQKWHPKPLTQLPGVPRVFWHPLKPAGLLRTQLTSPSQLLAQSSWIKYAEYSLLSNVSHKYCSDSVFMSSTETDFETNKSYPWDQGIKERTFWWVWVCVFLLTAQ